MAVGKGFKIADAFVEIHADKDRLRQDMSGPSLERDLGPGAEDGGRRVGKRLGKGVGDGADGKTVGKRVGDDVDKTLGPRSEKSGKDSGDKLARGMNLAIVRNAPLIAAGVAGALAAGAPAALAGATLLFAGIGIVAAAQSQQVRSAWAGAWTEIKADAIDSSQALVPVLTGAAARVSSAFHSMAPEVKSALTSVSGPLDNFIASLVKAGQNALPGFLSAVHNSGPVLAGLGSLVEHTGTGLSTFFSTLSQHSAESGRALDGLGRAVEALLSILGTLLAQGSVLGSVVLPMLATVLGAVAKALQLMAPVLPVIVAGFTALKVAQAAQGWLKGLGDESGRVSTALGGLVNKVPGLAGALPVLGAAVGLLISVYAQSRAKIDEWAQALLDGGHAAQQAAAQSQSVVDFWNSGIGRLSQFTSLIPSFASAMGMGANATDEMRQRAKELYDAMSPLQQKQQDVTNATNDLEVAIEKYGAGSGQAVGAAITLRDKQEELTRAQEELERATHGVTQAMLEQARQALAGADANFALRDAQFRVKDAQDALSTAIREHGANSEEAARATNDLYKALSDQAAAAGRAAEENSGLTDKTERNKVALAGQLQMLYQLREQFGTAFPADLQHSIDVLERQGVTLDWLGAKHPEPTVSLNDVPFLSTLMGTNGKLDVLNAQRPTPVANMNALPLQQSWASAMYQASTLNAQRPTPVAAMNEQPLWMSWHNMMGGIAQLAAQRPTPVGNLLVNTSSGQYAVDSFLYRNSGRSFNVFQNVIVRASAPISAAGGKIADTLAAQGFAMGGKLRGPGGPLDDLIPAFADGGQPIRLSNMEWIIRASSALKYGDAAMQAVNEGIAQIVVPRRRAVPTGGATPATVSSPSSAPVSVSDGARSITVENLTVKIDGTFDFSNPAAVRSLGAKLRDVLVALEREQR